MPLRYNGTLVTSVREQTENQEYSADAAGVTLEGIPDSLFLQHLNDAQDYLQAAITSVYPQEFVASKEISVVPNQQDYQIDDRVFINNKLLGVEYSYDGSVYNYSSLPPRYLLQQETYQTTHPSFYIRIAGKIRLCPIPTTSIGTIRPTYYRELDDLDIRRGTIASITGTTNTVTSLVFSAGADSVALASAEYVCVNDAHGNVISYNIPVGAYNSTTLTITPEGGSWALPSGYTLPAAGQYVTAGKWTTTHSKLSDNCERFLRIYTAKRIMNKDQSDAQTTESREMQDHLSTILSVYSDMSEDVTLIPNLTGDYL